MEEMDCQTSFDTDVEIDIKVTVIDGDDRRDGDLMVSIRRYNNTYTIVRPC